MKELEKKFVKNCDKVGDNTFTLVKQEGEVYMYHRTYMDGTHKSYEVFVSKFIKKGTPLPGGVFETEDRWQYPGANAFGRTAYDCKFEQQALDKFDELVKKVKQKAIDAAAEDSEEETPEISALDSKVNELKTGTSSEGKKRGRKPTDLSSIKYPSAKFTMNDFAELNESISAPTLYVHLKSLVQVGRAEVVDKIIGGRGKPKIVYSMKDEN